MGEVAAGGGQRRCRGPRARARLDLGGQFHGQTPCAALVFEGVAGGFQPLGTPVFLPLDAGGRPRQIAAGVVKVENLPVVRAASQGL